MTSYHGWTHASKEQGGTDPIPTAAGADPYISRILTTDGEQTIEANGAGEALLFDQDNNDEGATYFSIVNTSTTRVLTQGAGSRGVYRFLAAAKWNPVFDHGASMRITLGSWGWAPQVYFREIYGATGPHDQNGVMVLTFTARIYTTASSDFQVQVNHGHASSQVIETASLEVAYLGTFAGDAEGTFDFIN